jgi:hypothetical protein
MSQKSDTEKLDLAGRLGGQTPPAGGGSGDRIRQTGQYQKKGLAQRLSGRRRPDEDDDENEEEDEVSLPAPPPPVPPPVAQQRPVAAPAELLRLLRDPTSGRLIVEVAGQRYTRLADVPEREIGEYILKLAAHLLAFTGGMVATEGGVKSLPVPKVKALPMPLSAPPSISQLPTAPDGLAPPPDVEKAFLASLRTEPEAAPKKGGLFGRLAPSTSKFKEDEPLLPPLNLAEEINRIIQKRLPYTPLGLTTRIDIMMAPGGGIKIKVNGETFTGVDEVKPPGVQAFIRECIKEWEKS